MDIAISTLLASICGIIGNIVSFMVYLSPMPTFFNIYRRRSTESYHSFPYAIAHFSAMLYLYYAILKKENGTVLISINSFGVVIETVYLIIYLIYATPASKVLTKWIFLALNLGVFGLIILITMLAFEGTARTKAAGWICASVSVAVFASPLSIMYQVIRTKSVRYMPLMLSVMLTVCAVVWFFYGFLIHDYFIAFPNVLGFVLSIAQIALYACYRNHPEQNAEQELPTVVHPVVNKDEPLDAKSDTSHRHRRSRE
ncbi:unnamed protein product [Rhodiola kirilowii]